MNVKIFMLTKSAFFKHPMILFVKMLVYIIITLCIYFMVTELSREIVLNWFRKQNTAKNCKREFLNKSSKRLLYLGVLSSWIVSYIFQLQLVHWTSTPYRCKHNWSSIILLICLQLSLHLFIGVSPFPSPEENFGCTKIFLVIYMDCNVIQKLKCPF